MVDDGEVLRAALVIVPINFLWWKCNLPWAFKRRMEVNFVLAGLLTESCTVTNLAGAFDVLIGLIIFAFWIFQRQWARPKYAYEL